MNIRPLDIGFREDVDRRAKTLLAVVVVLAFIGSLLHRLPVTSSYRMWLITPVTPALAVVDSVRTALTNFFFKNEASERPESPASSLELASARTELRSLRHELAELRGICALPELLPLEGMAASVTGRSLGVDRRVLFIDAGTRDGVKKGAIVLGSDGDRAVVVGKVIESTSDMSKVQTMLDPGFRISARLASRGGFVYTGSSGNRDGRMEYVPRDENIAVGEEVLTSDDGRIFPGGYLIGTIKSIGAGSAIFHELKVAPAVSDDVVKTVWVAKERVR